MTEIPAKLQRPATALLTAIVPVYYFAGDRRLSQAALVLRRGFAPPAAFFLPAAGFPVDLSASSSDTLSTERRLLDASRLRCSTSMRLTTLLAAGRAGSPAGTSLPAARASIIANT